MYFMKRISHVTSLFKKNLSSIRGASGEFWASEHPAVNLWPLYFSPDCDEVAGWLFLENKLQEIGEKHGLSLCSNQFLQTDSVSWRIWSILQHEPVGLYSCDAGNWVSGEKRGTGQVVAEGLSSLCK